MATPVVHVDAFTSDPYAGNPAAVCFLAAAREPAWMQRVASELNLSETAFLVPGGDAFGLRWFSPRVEVDLCGHATLASAHALWETDRLARDRQARFDTKSGRLTADRRGEWIELDFPSTPTAETPAPPGLLESLRTKARRVERSRFDFLVEVDGEETVRAIAPDFGGLARIDARGIIVTSRASAPGVDFVSRFFAPAVGIDEDQATGSSHCALAVYWSTRIGKMRMSARQLSLRGGRVEVELVGERVRLAGQAVTVVRGELVA